MGCAAFRGASVAESLIASHRPPTSKGEPHEEDRGHRRTARLPRTIRCIVILFNHLLRCDSIPQQTPCKRQQPFPLIKASYKFHTMRTVSTMPVAATPQRISNKSFTAGSGATFMGQGLRVQNAQQRNVTTMAAKGTFRLINCTALTSTMH